MPQPGVLDQPASLQSGKSRPVRIINKSWIFWVLFDMVCSSFPDHGKGTIARYRTPVPTFRTLIVISCLIAIAVLFNSPSTFKSSDPKSAGFGNAIAVTVGGRSITLREVEEAAALPLYQADLQRHQLIERTIQRLIDEELLAAEASRKSITVSQLLAEASQSESIAKLANLPAPVKRVKPGAEHDSLDHLTSEDIQEAARVRQALLVSLRRHADIRVALQSPAPPIVPVSVDDDPSIGPVDAPVTIVEFSDFQCPYCKKSVGDLKELRRIYGQKVRLVYRDYPGPNHPYAQAAAEAAHCAGAQEKFWEYHDLLFERQTLGRSWDFLALAKELGLREDTFGTCLSSGSYRKEVAKDLQDGIRLGITSTPTFFVNGRPLIGARSVADFQKLIDPLLQAHPPS